MTYRLAMTTAAAVLISLGGAHAQTCKKGAAYKVSTSGVIVVVKRVGSGRTSFAPGARPQPSVALDLITPYGDRGVIFGPMRSVMFPTELRYLKNDGYRWKKASADPGGFFRVLTDDGKRERFTLTYVGCAR